MAGIGEDFPDPTKQPNKPSGSSNQPGRPKAKQQAQPKPKPKKPSKPTTKTPKPSKPTPKPRPVNPGKLELSSDDDDDTRIEYDDISQIFLDPNPRRALDQLRKRFGELREELGVRTRESEELIRENEILAKELNEAETRMHDRDSDPQSDGDTPMNMGGRRLTAAGAEGKNEYDRIHGAFSAADARRTMLVGQQPGHDDGKDGSDAEMEDTETKLAELRKRHRQAIRARRNARSQLDYDGALVRAAKSAQLHAKLGSPGIPLQAKQVINVSNQGKAPGVAHLAVLIMARDQLDEGKSLSGEVVHQDAQLAYEILSAHISEADNVLAMLNRGLIEDILFFEDVVHVPEYKLLAEEVNTTGRAIMDLLCDANVEKMLQIVRSQATQTRQAINFGMAPLGLDMSGQPIVSQTATASGPGPATITSGRQHAPRQNEIMFGTTSGSGYRADSAAKPVVDDSPGGIRFCQFFQKRAGCKKGLKCRYIDGHHCSVCGSRGHGAWKHAGKSRYQPYGSK